MAKRYASKTTVPIAKTRGEIDRLLRQWGADAIQWTDEFGEDRSTLRFVWLHEGTKYMARFSIRLAPIDPDDVTDLRTGNISPTKLQKAQDARGKQEHRVLQLWLKAALNAVDAGIIDAATVFLPFLEDGTGRTVAEIAVPRLQSLPGGRAVGLLETGTK
ncbi:MAG: hypothetical protein AAFQ82_05880 [Myxococcota bacterium]